jgi:glyoxylase-like metal-dependent hydrolase (beta-lactamase superfamily II)
VDKVKSRRQGVEMKIWTLIVAAIFCLSLSSCFERVIEPEDVFGAIRRGATYSPALESVDVEAPPLKVTGFMADGEVIALGNRTLDVLNLPGHTTESVVLIDRARNQTFTGDFVYKHLGGIIAFAPASDFPPYKANSDRLLQLTNIDTQFFGAHCFGRNGRCWWWESSARWRFT